MIARLPLAACIATLAAAVLTAPAPAAAGDAWSEIRAELYGAREVLPGDGIVTLSAPYRATDDREVPISATVDLGEGRQILSVALIIDENPMPVSAVFALDQGRESLDVGANMRLNGPSMVRAVVEADDGTLYMAAAKVKTSGLGACAAPPVTDADAAIATLGQMQLRPASGDLIAERVAALASGRVAAGRARLEMRHPSHSGLQMDQITLLYLPAHYVQTVEVWEDGARLFEMTGSISLSEDPEIEFTHRGDAHELRVRMTDTKGGVYEKAFALGAI